MKITNHYILFAIIVFSDLLTACVKVKNEEVFKFPVETYVPEPPRIVDIDPDSTLALKLHYDDSTYNTQMKAERARFSGLSDDFVFSLQAKLNNKEQLIIQLPLNDSGYVTAGKYIIRNNQLQPGAFPPSKVEIFGPNQPGNGFFAGYPLQTLYSSGNDTSNYSFTLVMEIDSMNRQEHLISGFIDTLLIVDKADTSRKELITQGEFAVLYNHFEIRINGVLEIPNGEFNAQPYTQSSNGGWGEFWQFKFDDSRLFTYSWEALIWDDERIALFNTNKGKGTYRIPYPGNIYWSIGYSDEAYTFFIVPSDTLTINLENFNIGQFAKGNIKFKGKEVDVNTGTDFIPGSQEKQYEIYFAYRDLL